MSGKRYINIASMIIHYSCFVLSLYILMQLTYTIKQFDLKPLYKQYGPQLVKTTCMKVESDMLGQEISIGMEWMSHEVEFHIAGLEEGVVAALQIIKQEFQVCIILYCMISGLHHDGGSYTNTFIGGEC